MTTTADMKSLNAAANVARDMVLPPLNPDHAGGLGMGVLVRESLESLLANKGRALLTMLGVIIGVASVVALMALGNGAERGDHRPGRKRGDQPHLRHAQRADQQRSGPRPGHDDEHGTPDADSGRCEGHRGAPPAGQQHQLSTSAAAAEMIAPSASTFTQIAGANAAYFEMNDLRAAQGTVFTEAQDRNGDLVVVLGANLAKDLFGDGQAVGQSVRVKDTVLRVIGVLAEKGRRRLRFDGQPGLRAHLPRPDAPLQRPHARRQQLPRRHRPDLGEKCGRHSRHPGPHHRAAARAAPS